MAHLLDGLLVIDFTTALSGPFCTMTLRDLGARVIKIEQPEVGEGFRRIGPFFEGQSGYFNSVNRGKESVTFDLKHPRALELVKDLVRKADIVVENFRPGVMDRLGLSYVDLKAINPRLIFLSISGFGQTGPYRDYPAFDVVVQAMSGLMSINGAEGGEPTRVGTSVGDIVPGMYGVIGVLGALERRHRTGEGGHVDISMMDGLIAIIENAMLRYWVTGEDPGPIGSRHPAITPFSAYPSADGYIVVAVANNAAMYTKFCQVIGAPELDQNPDYANNDLRNANVQQFTDDLSNVFRRQPTAYWLAVLREAGIPASPVNRMSDIHADAHVEARHMLMHVAQPGLSRPQIMPGTPVKVTGHNDTDFAHAPAVGEHTDSVLMDVLGLSQEDVDMLRVEEVV